MSIEEGVKSGSSKFDRLGLFVLMTSCLGQFLVVFDASIVNIALPKLLAAFNFDGSSLQWIINSYTIMFASLLIIGGILTDRFGAKKVFITGNLIFGVASLVAGFMSEAYYLVLARSLQGIAAGLIAPSTLSLIAIKFGRDPQLRSKAFGTWAAFASAGGAVGVLIGGVITEWLNWEWVFWVNVPITLILIILMVNYNDITEHERKCDQGITKALSVSLIFSASLLSLIFAAIEIPEGNSYFVPLMFFLFSIILLSAFWKMQLRLSSPILPKKLTHNHSLIIGNLTALITSGAIFSMYYFLTLMLKFRLNLSPFHIGLSYVPMTIAMFISARIAGNKIADKIGAQNTNIIGVLISCLSLLVIAISQDTSYIIFVVILGTFVMGIGQGIVTTTSSILATTEVHWQLAGTASALVNASRQVGGAIFMSSIVALTSVMVSGDPLKSQQGFLYALLITSALLFSLTIILLVYKKITYQLHNNVKS